MQEMEPNEALAAVRQAYMEAVDRRQADGCWRIARSITSSDERPGDGS